MFETFIGSPPENVEHSIWATIGLLSRCGIHKFTHDDARSIEDQLCSKLTFESKHLIASLKSQITIKVTCDVRLAQANGMMSRGSTIMIIVQMKVEGILLLAALWIGHTLRARARIESTCSIKFGQRCALK